LSSKVLFRDKCRRKTEEELANPGLPGKQPLIGSSGSSRLVLDERTVTF